MSTLKEKLEAAKKKNAAGTAEPKKRGRKKGSGTATAATKETTKRKKAIGFKITGDYEQKINDGYENLTKELERTGELICSFMEGKRNIATDIRTVLQNITKSCKNMRGIILETKNNMEAIYKD